MDDDYILMCNDCKCMVGEDHICDYNEYIDYTTQNNTESNNTNQSIIKGQNDSDGIERLISEVFIREPLWNSKLPYKQRGPADIKLLWSEVDSCLGTNPGSSQVKWKNVRDRFVKEYGVQNSYTASGSAAKEKKSSTWYLYETLSFLMPTVCYRKTKNNLENISLNRQSTSSIQESSLNNLNRIREQDSQEIRYRTNSTFENKSQNCPSKSSIQESIPNTNYIRGKNLQQTIQRPRSSECNIPESESLKINEVPSERSNSNNKTRPLSESEVPQSSKSTKHIKKSNTPADTRLEEALLRELELTRPTKAECQPKPDKIESFVKYIEACLREMIPESARRVMKEILQMLLEENI